MKKRHWNTLLSLLIISFLILGGNPGGASATQPAGSPPAAIAGAPARNPIPQGQVSIADTFYYEEDPDAAHNIRDDEYLIVYEQEGEIKGQRMLPDGSLYGGQMTLSGGSGGSKYPAVSYNHFTKTFLVVWQHEDPTGDIGIRGRTVFGAHQSSGGQFDTTVQQIQDSTEDESHPDVACNSLDSTCLVVYEYHYSSSDHDIFGQRMAMAAGSLTTDGVGFTIQNLSDNEHNPVVVWGEGEDNFLVTWTRDDASEGYSRIFFAHVFDTHQGGGGPSSEFNTLPTAMIPAASPYSREQYGQDAAYSPAHGEYLVAFVYDATVVGTNFDIFGQYIPGATNSFPVDVFWIGGYTNPEYDPSVTHIGGAYPTHNFAAHPEIFMVSFTSFDPTNNTEKLYIQNVQEGANDLIGFETLAAKSPTGDETIEDHIVVGSWTSRPVFLIWETHFTGGIPFDYDLYANRFWPFGIFLPQIVR